MEGREEKSLPGPIGTGGRRRGYCKTGLYRLVRIHCLHPQIRKGKEIVRRATMAVMANHSGSEAGKIQYILRDVFKIAPVELFVFTIHEIYYWIQSVLFICVVLFYCDYFCKN